MAGKRWQTATACVALAAGMAIGSLSAWAGPKRQPTAEELAGWPVAVKGFVPPAPGEHPRLLFRKGDLPALRKKAETPEGKAILRRLRVQLNGGDGESMPRIGGARGGGDEGGPAGVYSISHMAGFGLLYQLTGDKKYAELGKQCMEKAFAGTPNFDPRYAFAHPNGALRAGPSLGWTTLGYDLCYDGWDEAYRTKVAKAIAEYNPGKDKSLPELARGDRQHPGSNHWGMIVGGGAMALLGIMNDGGVDMAKIKPLLEASERSMKINLTQGFGDGGFFAEGDGTGSMSSHIVFTSALEAWRVAAGKDFYSPRPNAQWPVLKWFFLTALGGDPANLRASFPERGAYPQNIWSRTGISGGCYFGIGFGVADDEQKAAMLWFYDHSGLKALDAKSSYGLDAPSPYPHHSVLSFVNWPVGMAEKNPGEVLPHAFRDSAWKFYAWRNRWKDGDDVIISILAGDTKGNYGCKGENTLTIQTGGSKLKWGSVNGGFKGDFAPAADGSTVLTTGDGIGLAIDFSGASGADAMLVMAGPAVPGGNVVTAGGATFTFGFFGKGTPAKPQAAGDKVTVGGQTVSFKDGHVVLGKMAGPGKTLGTPAK